MKVIKFTKVNKVNKLNLEQFTHTPYSLQTLHYEDIIQGLKPHHIISTVVQILQCRTDGWCRSRREQLKQEKSTEVFVDNYGKN